MPGTPFTADALRVRLVDHGPLAGLELVAETGSTNDDLVARADSWPDPAVLVAESQTAGRGRLDRTWAAPPGTAVLASALLRPKVPPVALAWLPLITGLAVARTIRGGGVEAVLKWPNDVLAVPTSASQRRELAGWGTSRKVAGILARVVPGALVVGWGVNVHQSARDLPVETATSLELAGSSASRAEVLVGSVAALCELVARWEDADGDAFAAGIAADYLAVSATIGALVRVTLVDGTTLTGEAVGLDDDAALLVRSGDVTRSVHAGDVVHLRPRTGE